MRVIAGSARGTALESVPGLAVRPTTDRVKEAVFSILQFELPGKRVLDLFAGSGALGIEALSRGAAAATFVEQSAQAFATVQKNLQKTQLLPRATLHRGDALAFLQTSHAEFDIILIDPPYKSGLREQALARLAACTVLSPCGIILCERDAGELPAAPTGALALVKSYRYGKTGIDLYRMEGGQAP